MSTICNACGHKLEGEIHRVNIPEFNLDLLACSAACKTRLKDALLPSQIEKHGGTFIAEIDRSGDLRGGFYSR